MELDSGFGIQDNLESFGFPFFEIILLITPSATPLVVGVFAVGQDIDQSPMDHSADPFWWFQLVPVH
jgi:hypothetical protein